MVSGAGFRWGNAVVFAAPLPGLGIPPGLTVGSFEGAGDGLTTAFAPAAAGGLVGVADGFVGEATALAVGFAVGVLMK